MSQKKRNKTPWILRFISWAFPKLELIAPCIAKRWFTSVFFTPARYKMPPPELELIDKASKFKITYNNKKIQVYTWGDGQPILFVHGWMGRAAQFRKFIPEFTKNGYQVIAFDAPAHGLSDGRKTHLIQFADLINIIANQYNPAMIIGHSLGGIASIHALLKDRFASKLIMIGSPTISEEIIQAFADRLNASKGTIDYFHQYFKKHFGKSFEEFSGGYIIKDLREVDILVIQDEDDKDVSFKNAEVIMNKYEQARLLKTSGLGHTRILKDLTVIDACLDFAQKEINQLEGSLVE